MADNNFSQLVADFEQNVDDLNQVLSGDENSTVTIGGIEKPTISKALQDKWNSIEYGIVTFATYAELDAYTPLASEEKGSFKVTNDPDSSLNGYYSWVSDTTYTKDADLVVNTIDENNTSDAVSGAAVYDSQQDLLKTNVEDRITVSENVSRNLLIRPDTYNKLSLLNIESQNPNPVLDINTGLLTCDQTVTSGWSIVNADKDMQRVVIKNSGVTYKLLGKTATDWIIFWTGGTRTKTSIATQTQLTNTSNYFSNTAIPVSAEKIIIERVRDSINISYVENKVITLWSSKTVEELGLVSLHAGMCNWSGPSSGTILDYTQLEDVEAELGTVIDTSFLDIDYNVEPIKNTILIESTEQTSSFKKINMQELLAKGTKPSIAAHDEPFIAFPNTTSFNAYTNNYDLVTKEYTLIDNLGDITGTATTCSKYPVLEYVTDRHVGNMLVLGRNSNYLLGLGLVGAFYGNCLAVNAAGEYKTLDSSGAEKAAASSKILSPYIPASWTTPYRIKVNTETEDVLIYTQATVNDSFVLWATIPKAVFPNDLVDPRCGFVAVTGDTPLTLEQNVHGFRDSGYIIESSGIQERAAETGEHLLLMTDKTFSGMAKLPVDSLVKLPFFDKKVSAVGDSITTFANYVVYLKEKLQANVVSMDGTGGWYLQGGANSLAQDSVMDTVIAKEPDLIIIMAGTNDSSGSNVGEVVKPVGQSDADYLATSCGGLRHMFDYYQRALPLAKIVFVSPVLRQQMDDDLGYGITPREVYDRLREVAKLCCIPIVDATNELGWSLLMLEDDISPYYPAGDWTHPNDLGHDALTTLIANRVNNLY